MISYTMMRISFNLNLEYAVKIKAIKLKHFRNIIISEQYNLSKVGIIIFGRELFP